MERFAKKPPQPYLQKQTKDNLPFADLLWNIPEQKTGTLNIIGGSPANFANIAKISNLLAQFPLKTTRIILPDSLKQLFPKTMPSSAFDDIISPELHFVPSTTQGTLDFSKNLSTLLSSSDVNLFLGENSKNSATALALSAEITKSTTQTIITRDTIDLIAVESHEFITNPNLCFVCSFSQLQKLFRVIYYPKVLLFSMPLIQATDTLHKFTLSYPVSILTFHADHLIVAYAGKIIITPLVQTKYTPLSLWSGELALKIAALNVWLPNQKLANLSNAIYYS